MTDRNGKRMDAHLKLVSPLVVVQLPAAAADDGEHLLLLEGRQHPVQEDLQLGGNGVAALEDGPGHLVHGGGGRHLALLLDGVLLHRSEAQISESCQKGI